MSSYEDIRFVSSYEDMLTGLDGRAYTSPMTYNVTLHMKDGRYLTTIIDGVRYADDAFDRAVEHFDVAYSEVDMWDADAI